MKWLICLAGCIASGKTTLADALHAALPGSVRLAFGDVVRRRASAVRRDPTRQELQETGLQLIREGWPAFIDELLSGLECDPPTLIVEGVRHREAVDALREYLPEWRLFLVYVEAPDDQRRQRLVQRAEQEQALSHEVERGVEALRAVADLMLPSDRPADELVARIQRQLNYEA